MLGAPNDDAGNLSSIALERCRRALTEYRAAPGWSVLPTGGFGEHFNRSPEPHAHLTRRWLLAQGVPERDLLEPVLSRFTFEDAALSKPVVERYGVRQLKVVTSDFHVVRARSVFEQIFPDHRLSFSGSTTRLPRPGVSYNGFSSTSGPRSPDFQRAVTPCKNPVTGRRVRFTGDAPGICRCLRLGSA